MLKSPADKRTGKSILYVGLDVHKETIAEAVAEDGRDGEVRSPGSFSNDLHVLEKRMREHQRRGYELRVCYEAGPCGFGIARRLRQLGIDGQVIAPSLIPQKSGDRQKNDQRDAVKLARCHRAGELTAVHVAEPTDEALRDLCRARTDAVNDQRRSRQQLKACLLRLGYKYGGKTSWNAAHERYLRELVLPHAAHKLVLEEYLQSVATAGERVARITGQIELLAPQWRLWPAVQAVMSLRGFQVLSATLFLSELGELTRFAHPGKLMAYTKPSNCLDCQSEWNSPDFNWKWYYLGLLPSEYSSGESQHKGAITKCGNGHVRWILTEAAQHYFLSPKVSQELSRRQQGQPRRIQQISWQAQNRLYRRGRALLARGKTKQTTVIAIARELAGFLWAIYHEWQTPSSATAEGWRIGCGKAAGAQAMGAQAVTPGAVRCSAWLAWNASPPPSTSPPGPASVQTTASPGGRILSTATRDVKSRTAYALRMAAQALHRSQSALGDFFRRMKARLGAPAAITATAHKRARILHHLIKHRCPYDASVFAAEEELHRQRREKNLRKQAALFGFQLTSLQSNS